jgi:DNA invertase Pin-like site-specific DNA recombinase
MGKILAYIRVSTNKQDVSNQKFEILEHARKKGLIINDYIEVNVSSRASQKKRRIRELLDRMDDYQILIVTEISRLGRSTSEVLDLINFILGQEKRVIILKQNMDLTKNDMASKVMVTMFSLFSELERDLISLRTKEALAAKKAKGIRLGKPVGTIQKSKYDVHRQTITEWLELGLSIRKIAKNLGFPNHNSLAVYIRKRNLKNMDTGKTEPMS